jgi:hypothetical protein
MTKPPLVACAACERHVRAGEPRCPFCGAVGSIAAAPPLRVPKGRLSSLLVMTFHAAAAAATTVGCGGETSDPVPPNSGGTAGHAGTGGRGVVGTGGEETGDGNATGSGGFSTGSGGRSPGSGGSANPGTGGLTEVGTGGDPWQGRGGAVPIYRATPRG